MYTCDYHGKQTSNWCPECEKLLGCDCSSTQESRFKDLIIDCDDGEKTITVYVDHCMCCGNTFGPRIK